MDVIALAQAGFAHAVAPLGTAIGEAQLAQLWQLADEPLICLDGDEAGLRAGHRLIERALPLLKPGKSLRFAILPPGRDPDSVLRARSGAFPGAQRSSSCSTRRSRSWIFCGRVKPRRVRPRCRSNAGRWSNGTALWRPVFRARAWRAVLNDFFRRLKRLREARGAGEGSGSWFGLR